jgi:hypothetical protein
MAKAKTVVRGWVVQFTYRDKAVPWREAAGRGADVARIGAVGVWGTRAEARENAAELDRLYGDTMRYRIRRATVTLEIE